MNADFLGEPCVFGEGERTAEIRPVADMVCIQVVRFAVDGFNHRRKTFHVGKRKGIEQHHGIQGRKHCGGVELLCLTFAQNFGVALVVVVDESDNFGIFLCLLDGDVVEGSVAQVLYCASLVVFALVLVAFR